MPDTLESEHRFMHFNTMNCICHTGSYWSRKTQAAGRHNTHVQTGAFRGSCHFILGHYAPDMFLTTDRTVSAVRVIKRSHRLQSKGSSYNHDAGYLNYVKMGTPGCPYLRGVYIFMTPVPAPTSYVMCHTDEAKCGLK